MYIANDSSPHESENDLPVADVGGHEGMSDQQQKPAGTVGPWWSGTGQLIYTLGPVTVAFFLYLFVGLGWLPSPMLVSLSEGASLLSKNQKIIQDIQTDLRLHKSDEDAQQAALLRSLRQICRNTAKTPQQNERCDDMDH